MGHEKGHYLQELVWPHRNYETDHHAMETEADLIGAWVLAMENQTIGSPDLTVVVRWFDDANRIARQFGIALGDTDGNAPHHPWAQQRELALVRGPQIALLYPGHLTIDNRGVFADGIRNVARQVRARDV